MTLTRRKILSLVLGLGGVGFIANAFQKSGGAKPLPLTPACDDGDADPTEYVMEGPFYTPNTPKRSVLREAGTVGTPLVLTGRVLTRDCKPIAGAVLDFWQCDGKGVYDTEGFKLRGHLLTDASGAFRVETVKPASYKMAGRDRAPHIHVKVQGPRTRLLTTQLFFPGEPLNAQDWFVEESLIMQVAKSGSGSLAARFDFVLA